MPFFQFSSSHRLLEKTGGIEEAGGLQGELLGYLLFAWVIVYLCVFKGVKSTGKVRMMSTFLQNVLLHSVSKSLCSVGIKEKGVHIFRLQICSSTTFQLTK